MSKRDPGTMRSGYIQLVGPILIFYLYTMTSATLDVTGEAKLWILSEHPKFNSDSETNCAIFMSQFRLSVLLTEPNAFRRKYM